MARSLCMPVYSVCYAEQWLTAHCCAEHDEHDVLLLIIPRRPLSTRPIQGYRP